MSFDLNNISKLYGPLKKKCPFYTTYRGNKRHFLGGKTCILSRLRESRGRGDSKQLLTLWCHKTLQFRP